MPAEEEAASAVRELRRLIALYDGTDLEPGSEMAAKLDAARRAVAAYEEVQSWNLTDRRSA